MTTKVRTWTAGCVVLCLIGIASIGVGCNLFGITGPQGPQGPPGLDAGSSLPGTTVAIQSVGGAVSAGGPFSVTFTLMTAGEDPIDIDDLDRFSIYASGPATNYQRVIVPEDERETSITDNGSGSYTYTFAGGFPATYAAPPNDSDAFGTTDGELTGTAIQAGTYTVAVEGRRSFMIDGETIRDAGDATFDFAVGGATLTPRQVVLEANCEKCHNDVTLHGENRFAITGCVLCHVKGGEDRISEDAAKATTGRTIWFANMIHKIHRGKDLPQVAATANGADPYTLDIIGYGDSLHDFSHVGFPRIPGGVRECDACHADATQGSQAYSTIGQAICSSCHDDIDFTSGTILDSANTTVTDGTLTKAQLSDASFRTTPGGTTQHTFGDDSACTLCHGAGKSWAVQTVHMLETSTDSEGTGPAVEIVSVTGQTGGGGAFFVAGDFPEITFRLSDANNDPLQLVDGKPTVWDRVEVIVAGPTALYQTIIESQRPWSGGSLNTAAGNWTDNFATDGTYTFTSEDPFPAFYPAQLNSIGSPPADQVFPFAEGWGQQYTAAGTRLDNGTYTIFLYGRRVTVTSGDREPAQHDTFDIVYGSNRTIVPYGGLVTSDKCNACHGALAFHGNAREGVHLCLACHTAGTQDEATTEGVDFRILLHRIHNAANLDVVTQGGSYQVNGHGGLTDFSHALLPAMPGGAKHCTACHATDAWKDPPERTNMQTWMVVCTSCHDSAATAAHVTLNTVAGAPGSEACATCHGDGAAFSIEKSHMVY